MSSPLPHVTIYWNSKHPHIHDSITGSALTRNVQLQRLEGRSLCLDGRASANTVVWLLTGMDESRMGEVGCGKGARKDRCPDSSTRNDLEIEDLKLCPCATWIIIADSEYTHPCAGHLLGALLELDDPLGCSPKGSGLYLKTSLATEGQE